MRRLRLGCAAVLLAVLAPVACFGIWVTLGLRVPVDAPHHPFRSDRAKDRFLSALGEMEGRWPVMSDTLTIQTPFGPTFVRISGDPEAPPLVLLNGAGGNSLQWRPNIGALSAHFRTYAVDGILDFGRSVYTHRPTGADDLVVWLEGVLTGLSIQGPVNLVGLSFGAWISAQFALQRSERVRAVVLLAPSGTVLPFSSEWIRRAILSAIPIRFFMANFLEWLMADWASGTDADRLEVDREIDVVFQGLQSFKPQQMVNPTVLTDEELGALPARTLVLYGENERLYSARAAQERLRRAAPQTRVEVLPGAGHDLTFVLRQRVNALIVEFLLDRGPDRAGSTGPI